MLIHDWQTVYMRTNFGLETVSQTAILLHLKTTYFIFSIISEVIKEWFHFEFFLFELQQIEKCHRTNICKRLYRAPYPEWLRTDNNNSSNRRRRRKNGMIGICGEIWLPFGSWECATIMATWSCWAQPTISLDDSITMQWVIFFVSNLVYWKVKWEWICWFFWDSFVKIIKMMQLRTWELPQLGCWQYFQ